MKNLRSYIIDEPIGKIRKMKIRTTKEDLELMNAEFKTAANHIGSVKEMLSLLGLTKAQYYTFKREGVPAEVAVILEVKINAHMGKNVVSRFNFSPWIGRFSDGMDQSTAGYNQPYLRRVLLQK